MISGDSVLVHASCWVEGSHTTAASAAAHEYHEYKETVDQLSISLVGAVVAEPWIRSVRVKSDGTAADVLGRCFAKRSELANWIPAEAARDNDCSEIDTLC